MIDILSWAAPHTWAVNQIKSTQRLQESRLRCPLNLASVQTIPHDCHSFPGSAPYLDYRVDEIHLNFSEIDRDARSILHIGP